METVAAARICSMKVIPSIAFNELSTSCFSLLSLDNVCKQPLLSLTASVLDWNALAGTQKGKSVLGTSSKISGANLYSRLNCWIVKCGGAALSSPPTLVGVEAPCEAELALSTDSFTFQLPDPPAETADLKLVIMASAPQSNGVTKAYSKAVTIGSPRTIVEEAIDIKADYEAVHGAVTTAAPKVFAIAPLSTPRQSVQAPSALGLIERFLRYFFVNTKTGEKSGEMLGQISL